METEPDNAIRLSGQDLACALRDAVREEIKNTSAEIYELGRFLFGVGTASLGLVITLSTFAESASLGWVFAFALVFFAISMVLALWMAIPKVRGLSGNTDLVTEHNELMDQTAVITIVWALSWAAGAILGTLSIFVI